ncbi:MAG: hypothetical protein MEQ74_05080 [Paracoccus sp.]|nr:hypothetical protein [Paracoccus sp. (in: a-proteobacteria)]
MTPTNRLEAAQKRVEDLTAALHAAELATTEASTLASLADKADKVEARLEATKVKQKERTIANELRQAKADVKSAERDVAAANKKTVVDKEAAQKQADLETRRAAAIAAEEARVEAALENPFVASDVNWTVLGKWCAKRLENTACFVEGMGWGEWTGCCWQFSGSPSATLLDRVRDGWAGIVSEVTEKLNANPSAGEHALNHAKGSLLVHRNVFNADTVAHLVAFQNITIDLRTGETMPNNPTHYMTGALQCNYNPEAEVERIEAAFARYWPGDKETARCFQLAVGYSLTGEKSAKRIPMLIGNQDEANKNGDNGKSTFQNALLQVLGTEKGGWGGTVKSGLIVDTGDRDANSHDGAKAPLLWKRFAMASEVRKGASINSGEFNVLSGYDSQPIRTPYGKESIQAVIVATTWFSMNNAFRFKTWDKATKERILSFPFNESFYDAHNCPPGGQLKDLALGKWLSSPAGQEALALYAVQGAGAFYAQNDGKPGNLPMSPVMEALREQILRTSNPHADLFEDFFDFDPAWDTEVTVVSKILRDTSPTPVKAWEKDQFVAALKGMGVTVIKVKGDRYYRGMRLTEKGQKFADTGGHRNASVQRGQVFAIAAE